MTNLQPKPRPLALCDECSGPNGYHSPSCSIAEMALADKFDYMLTPADYRLLNELKITVSQ